MPSPADSDQPKRRRGRPPKVQATQYLTVHQVQGLIPGFAVSTIYQWTRELCADGKPVLPAVKFGPKRILFHPESVEAIPARLMTRLPRPVPSFFSRKRQPREVANG